MFDLSPNVDRYLTFCINSDEGERTECDRPRCSWCDVGQPLWTCQGEVVDTKPRSCIAQHSYSFVLSTCHIYLLSISRSFISQIITSYRTNYSKLHLHIYRIRAEALFE